MIELTNITKEFSSGKQVFEVLKGINLTIDRGDFVAIMGPSGSGKSTLLNLMGGLDYPTKGSISIQKTSLESLSENKFTLYRRKNIGFIFQNYQLIQNMTAFENIAFPLYADKIKHSTINKKVSYLLSSVKLDGKAAHFPSQLSGGQQQRVAIARALAMDPSLILADEPTGNLDRKTGTDILKLLSNLHQKENLTIVMVTHDIYAASFANRIILLKDGVIDSDFIQKDGEKQYDLESILKKLNS